MRPLRSVPKEAWRLLSVALPVLIVTAILMTSWVRAEDGENVNRILREKSYYYKAFNRRDPFQSLIVGEFEETEFDLVDIYSVRLVGVLTGEMKRFAMLEDNNGFSYIVQSGDPVKHGHIVSVGDRMLVARVTMFGQTNSVTLRLEEGMGKGE